MILQVGVCDGEQYEEVPLEVRIKPIPSMYGIFTYIWLICMVNVGKYTIHGSYGKGQYLSYNPN